MNQDYEHYLALKRLKENKDFHVLEALWAIQGTEILETVKKAASRGQESAWRYRAGEMSGFEMALTQLDRAIAKMETVLENQNFNINVDDLIKEIKGTEK